MSKYKLIIAGSRHFVDEYKAVEVINFLMKQDHIPDESQLEIVCGEARGADTVGRNIAEHNNIPIASFPADWEKHGRGAGYIRNSAMANYADGAVIFWDGSSKGSKHMRDLMIKIGKFCHVVYIPKPGRQSYENEQQQLTFPQQD